MNKLILILDHPNHKELKNYLLSLNGIKSIRITNVNFLRINITYDDNIIDDEIIKKEIYLFLDLKDNIPYMIGFDKCYSDSLDYKYILKDICCEYCFEGFIEELYNIKGITSISNNFDGIKLNNIKINIGYDKNILSLDNIKEIIYEFEKN